MKKSWLVVISVLLIVMTACGKNNDATNSEASEKPGSGAAESGAKSVKLKFWHAWTGDDEVTKAFLQLIEKFQAEHPNIELEILATPHDSYKTLLKTAAAANDMPDVFLTWAGAMTKELVDGQAIGPIDELLLDKPEWRDQFLPNSFSDFTFGNQVYSVPMELTPTSFVYYNKTLFDENNVKVPETWDELKTAIDTFKANDIIPIALGNKATWLAQSSIFSALADRVTGTEWFLKAAALDGAQFTDPEFIQALGYLKELSDNGAFQDGFSSIDNVGQQQLYNQGKAAMFIEGAWAITNLVSQSPPDILEATHLTVLPSIPGGKGNPQATSGVAGLGPAISSKVSGDKKAAAFELIYALAGPEAQKMSVDNNKLVSYKVEASPEKVSPLFAEANRLVGTLELTPVYDAVLPAAGTDAVNNGLMEVLLGAKPEDVANRIQKAVEQALGK
ncbi:extracellular solute-binding protein [Paenibacillaceae bacterium WGS1546]|uniref:extracellular solute-binding protein n=1 Tax=Cohnella sp. WGS1546 TaxID=3366810 RepID=UPI00372CF245